MSRGLHLYYVLSGVFLCPNWGIRTMCPPRPRRGACRTLYPCSRYAAQITTRAPAAVHCAPGSSSTRSSGATCSRRVGCAAGRHLSSFVHITHCQLSVRLWSSSCRLCLCENGWYPRVACPLLVCPPRPNPTTTDEAPGGGGERIYA